MNIYACLLARVSAGDSIQVANNLQKLDFVGLVVPITGPYDLLIIIRSQDPTTLGEIIVDKIQKIHEIQSTLSLVAVGEMKPINWMVALGVIEK